MYTRNQTHFCWVKINNPISMEVQKYIKLIKILYVHTNFDENVFFFSFSHTINEQKAKLFCICYISSVWQNVSFLFITNIQDNIQETHSSGILKSLCFVAKKNRISSTRSLWAAQLSGILLLKVWKSFFFTLKSLRVLFFRSKFTSLTM